MGTALEMLGREAFLLGVLGLLGSGAAAWIPGPPLARLALAPSFGLAIGAAVTLTAAEFMPMKTAAFAVILPLCVASVALAYLAHSRRVAQNGSHSPENDPSASGAGAVALVLGLLALTATGLNAALIDADSPGPVGYKVADAPTYVQLSGIFEDHAWTDEQLGPPWDQPAQGFRALLDSDVFQTTGSSPLPAALAGLPGWRAVDTQSAFSITTILAGSLAALAVVLILGGLLWPSLLAALLYAGPLTYQLFIDGSQAALIALALVPAIGIAAVWLLRDGIRIAALLLLALLLAGMLPVYPLLVPLTAASIVLGALVAAALQRRRGRLDSEQLRRGALALGAVALAAIAISPLAFERSVSYWHSVGAGFLDQPLATAFGESGAGGPTAGDVLPHYDLPAQVLPGWVLQTREFYGLDTLRSSPEAFLLGGVAVLALLALIAFGVRRLPWGSVYLAPVPLAAALALYSAFHDDCSYCVQRNLLLLGACAPILIGLGVAALGRGAPLAGAEPARGRRSTTIAAVVGVAIAAVVVYEASIMARRAIDGAYVMPAELRSLIDDAAASDGGSLQLEGFLALPESNFEYPSAFADLRQTSDRRLSGLPSVAAIEGEGPFGQGEPFDPRYEEVLTRLRGIDSGRQTIAASGPYALQRRNGQLDVTVASGVTVDAAKRDRSGEAWVTGPIGLVIADLTGRPASVRLRLAGPDAAQVGVAGPARIAARDPGAVSICMPVPGSGPVRIATVELRFPEPAGGPPPEEYGTVPVPPMGLRLARLRAVGGGCQTGSS